MNDAIDTEPLQWIEFEITDFDHFQEVVYDWELDFHQLDGGSFHSKLEQIILPEIQIGHTHFDCHLDQKGNSPKKMWTFVLMGEDATMFNFNHVKTTSTSTMVIYSPGQKIDAVTAPGFSIYTLSVEQAHFQKVAASLGLEKIEEKLRQIDIIELDLAQTSSLREQLQNVLSHVSSMDEKVMTDQGKALFLELLPTKFLKEIYLHVGCAPKRVFKKKYLLYMEARAYMHTHSHEPITIEDIAKKSDLSERTLRNYFQEELAISPKQYLTTIRLQRVREILKAKDETLTTVEQTARRSGFHHMGQFSQSYKEFFGELPSETLIQR